jgi:RNA polymerase sigma factor (sigma-70 family)
MNGTELLADFRGSRSEQAFGALVRHYTNLVYSVARRRLANGSLAEEVTQMVFIRLARSAPNLRGDAELVGWLHRTTVHVSVDLWRSESRRRHREEQAAAMQLDVADTSGWDDLASVLDDALNELNDSDRQAILLRFFDGKAMRDLGAVFGISEDAAKMRVSRAVDRLRLQLGTRGVTCSAAALGSLLAERAVEAAPNQLVARLAALRFAGPAGLGAVGSVYSFFMQFSKFKFIAGVGAVVFVGAVAFLLMRSGEGPAKPAAGTNAPKIALAPVASAQGQAAATAATEALDAAAPEGNPDPLKLLQAVAQARQRIGSGSIEFQFTSERLERGRKETNHLQLAALFDGQKLRWEQVGTEYSYTAMGDASAAQEARIQEEGLDKAAAVRAGLLKDFESHHVSAYDGAALLEYWEVDGKSNDAVINEPGKGSSRFIFDPRCLGLREHLFVDSTVESCLGYNEAKSIKLIGRESVDGVPAWHVQVKSKHDEILDFWMDVAQPVRVLKHAIGPNVVVSKYQASTTSPPIPVSTVAYRNGAPWFRNRFIRTNAYFNKPVDPASFTLAGLGMQVGAAVSDIRIHRRIGYWTGAGLSAYPPSKSDEAQTPRNMAELLALLESAPASRAALEAATWIILNTPDGPEVEKAGEVILREHTADTNLVRLCKELERVRPRCSTNLLEAILKNNPRAEVRATACFNLATMLKAAARFGQDQKATAEAEKLFEHVTTEFARIGPAGAELARKARPELYDLRHLIIGKPAPETEGEDLDGHRMNLRDYRGKVVVLVFWTDSTASGLAEHRKLAGRLAGEPLSLVGVNCDDNLRKAKAAAEKYEVTWPSFWDKQSGPISVSWNVRGWLTTIVLDAKGVIRYREVRGGELNKAVEALLRE